MKQLTVCIDDGLQGEVVYRAEISHTEEDYQELKSDLEFVREENKKLNAKVDVLQLKLDQTKRDNKRLEEENKKLREENEELHKTRDNRENKIADLEIEIYRLREELSAYDREYFDEDKKAKNIFKEGEKSTITITDEDNRIILEKGEDGKRHSYGGGDVVLC